jgi:hypothetical protein
VIGESVGEARVITLSFEEGEDETVEVEEIGPEWFRLCESPISADPSVYLGDVVEARADAEGSYRFQRVIERSGLKTLDRLLPREVAESGEMSEFCEAVEQRGGFWERVMGGCFFIHLPPDATLDAEKELGTVMERVRSRGSRETGQGEQIDV